MTIEPIVSTGLKDEDAPVQPAVVTSSSKLMCDGSGVLRPLETLCEVGVQRAIEHLPAQACPGCERCTTGNRPVTPSPKALCDGDSAFRPQKLYAAGSPQSLMDLPAEPCPGCVACMPNGPMCPAFWDGGTKPCVFCGGGCEAHREMPSISEELARPIAGFRVAP